MVNINGFEIFRLDREAGNIRAKSGRIKCGGGLVTYVKQNLAKYTSIIEEASSISPEIEQLWIRIEKPNMGVKIVANIYRPPNANLKAALTSLSASTKLAQTIFRNKLV